MGDTFLWMPRPRTIVVKDGKPVIDCNPKQGKVTINFDISISVEYYVDTSAEYDLSPSDIVENCSPMEITVYGYDSKITGYSGGDAQDIEKHEKVLWLYSYVTNSQTGYYFDARLSATIDIATLPCISSRLGFSISSPQFPLIEEMQSGSGTGVYAYPSVTNYYASITIENSGSLDTDVSYYIGDPDTACGNNGSATLSEGDSQNIFSCNNDGSYDGNISIDIPV